MSIEQALLEGLNPQQAEAVQHHGSPLLIIAGAGSGKTRVITHRIAYLHLVVGIPLWQIMAVTFTNKAAREMKERVARILDRPNDPSLAISTFHSRCAMLLRREAEAAGLDKNFAILDERDQKAAIKKALDELGFTDKKVKPSQAQSFINLAKMKMLTADECEEEFINDEINYAAIYKEYENILEKNKSLDFEDLIFKTVRLFQNKPDVCKTWQDKFPYILVDEFQDTNHGQFELIKLLAGTHDTICVVGDEDQSIYSWRGADVQNLLHFQDSFKETKVIRLEQNYRSVGNVLKAAHGVIKNNTMRLGKELWTEKEEGEKIQAIMGLDDKDEAEQVSRQVAGLIATEGVAAEEIAVFYRSHMLSRSLEDAFRRFRVPYRIVGGMRFYDRAEIKDLLSYLRLVLSLENDLAFERIVNTPKRGLGPKAQSEIMHVAAFQNVSYFEGARAACESGAIKGKAKKSLEQFLDLIESCRKLVAEKASVRKILSEILEGTNYKEDGVGDPNSVDGQARLDNIEEFENTISAFEEEESEHTLDKFLEVMALDSQMEQADERPKVSFMTVHNAKGLEFDHVFVVGMENGVFPNSRTFDDPAQYEEERRLFYVAITRARQRLTLCRAMRRMRQGMYDTTELSGFLRELPEEVMSEDNQRLLGIKSSIRSGDLASTGWRGEAEQRLAKRRFGSQYSAVSTGRRGGWGGSPSSKSKFTVGDRVEHTIMGEGIITEMGGRPGNERVYVEFDDGRSQEFVVRFAPLTKVE